MKLRLLLTAILASAAPAQADIITLDDGSVLHGRALRTPTGFLITRDDGKTITVGPDNIVAIEFTRSAPPQAAMDGLTSIRNVVQNMDDLTQIIERYQRFISTNTDPHALAEATADLQTWQQRQQAGLVKIGAHWVTPDQRDQLRRQSQSEALSARDLLLQNRTEEAQQLLTQALSDDPACATAIYIQGVQFYNGGHLADARDAFNSANSIAPNYAPTLNNLAVIAWRFASRSAAMGFYDQAMLASPVARPILDNVAEALAALTPQESASPLAQQAAADFRQQDAILQARRAKEGLYRWGSGWVSAPQLSQLQSEADKFNRQLDDLQSQIDAIQQRIGQIDSEIDQNNRVLHRMEASSYIAGENGIVYQMQLPLSYDQVSDDNRALKASKLVLQNQQDAVTAQMNKIQQAQQQSPNQQFTGQQRIIGIEAAPLRQFDSPATLPATQP
ncbi:MAG: hypothetical protein ABSF29_11300 [Tepidisphaeraceae bacterium]|jgi:tetratricopeptide (TPR) repeat protein